MRQPVVFLLNGPPRSGKDTAYLAMAEYFNAQGFSSRSLKFTHPIKKLTHEQYGLTVSLDYYEAQKDIPLVEFHGRTPREAYIETSTKAKQQHGEDIFIRILMEEMSQTDEDVIIFPDVGNKEEGDAIISTLGASECRLIRIHKEGHDFGNCCREYFHLPGIITEDMVNTEGYEAAFKNQVVEYIASFDWTAPYVHDANKRSNDGPLKEEPVLSYSM